MAPALHGGPDTGQLLLGHAVESQFLAPQMHGDENAHVIQEARHQTCEHNFRVRNADVLSHDKAGGAHDGGNQLSAGGGAGFHSTGKLWGITALFHQGNGKGAGAHHVGGGSAGDGAERGTGDNGHLGRAAGGASRQAQGDILNEITHAASLQQRAEEDEQRHVCSGSAQGASKDALGNHEHVIGHAGKTAGLGLEHARHDIAEVGIDQENEGNQGQRGTD